jgi:hypothetical protein
MSSSSRLAASGAGVGHQPLREIERVQRGPAAPRDRRAQVVHADEVASLAGDREMIEASGLSRSGHNQNAYRPVSSSTSSKYRNAGGT